MITIRNQTKKKVKTMPLQPGDQVTSLMRPDITYTVVERSSHLVKVSSNLDGGEGWVSRSVLRRVEPET